MSRKDVLRQDIKSLLGSGDPQIAAPPIAGHGKLQIQAIKAPPSGSDKAICCPQCDEWTWKQTELCIYCLFDQAAYFKNQQLQREKIVYQDRSRRFGYLALGMFFLAIFFFMASQIEMLSVSMLLMIVFGFLFTHLFEKSEKIEV